MTFPRLYALMNYWKNHPPVHFLVAGIAGYKHEEPKNDLSELCGLFEQIGGEVKNG